jgi:PAS domain S-box-containing protein
VRDVLESLRDGVVILDPGGRITAWNRAMAERWRRPAGAVVGRRVAEVLPGLGAPETAEGVARLAAGLAESLPDVRLQVDLPVGGPRTVDVRGSAVRAGDGTARGAILLVEDVTERLALEGSLRESERLASLGTLAAGVAHQINNPIGVITSRVELMLEEMTEPVGGPRLREDLEVVRAHAHRVARITQGLLAFARHRPGQKVPVDLNRVVEDTALLVESQLERERIGLRLELASGLPWVAGDPTLLGQALLNLLNNARDALAPGGQITVRTEADPRDAHGVRLVVRDTGAGIPAEHLAHVFEPFYTTKPQGTGLGLAVCYGIVRNHLGLIGVESRPGEGTTFVLTLPGMGGAARQEAG